MSNSLAPAIIGILGALLVCLTQYLFTRRFYSLQTKKLRAEIEHLQAQAATERDLSQRLIRGMWRNGTPDNYLTRLINDLHMPYGSQVIPGEIDNLYVQMNLESSKGERTSGAQLLDRIEASHSRHGTTIILGDPGSGKSTLIRRWAQEYSEASLRDDGKRLPLYAPLSVVGQMPTPLPTQDSLIGEIAAGYIYGTDSCAPRDLSAAFDQHIDSGNALILLDGMDEVPEDRRDLLRRAIVAILTRHPGNIVIVTSRPLQYMDNVEGSQRLYVSEFDEEQRRCLVRNWFASGNTSTRDIEELVESADRQLTANPLYLTMLCLLLDAENRGTIPTPGVLFELFVRELLEVKPSAIGMTLGYETHDKLQLLQYISTLLQDEDRRVISEDRLFSPLVSSRFPEAPRVVREIAETSGLLQRRNTGVYQFLHPLFLEFFAARGLAAEVLSGSLERDEWIALHGRDPRYENISAFLPEILEMNMESPQ